MIYVLKTVESILPTLYDQNKVHSNKPSRELTSGERSELFERIRIHYPL